MFKDSLHSFLVWLHRLEEKAAMKEDALKKSENLLEEDALRFGDFLKENDQKAHDALKMVLIFPSFSVIPA